MNSTTDSIAQRTAVPHIHPALTYEQHVNPLRFDVFFDGLELGTVTTYLGIEALGREWLAYLLDEDAMDPGDVLLAQCPKTGWTVMPSTTVESGIEGIVWFMCSACDSDERTRNDPEYDPSHPGPHLLDTNKTTPPPQWQSRYQEATP